MPDPAAPAPRLLVALSGAYLLYYFWVVEVNEDSSAIVRRVERLQTRVQATFIDHWVVVALVLGAVVAAAVAYVAGRRSDAPAH